MGGRQGIPIQGQGDNLGQGIEVQQRREDRPIQGYAENFGQDLESRGVAAVREMVASLGGQYGAAGEMTWYQKSITQPLESGQVFWHPDTGTIVLYGAILARYRELGALKSKLGYPLDGENEDLGGALVSFKNGMILWRHDLGAHEVIGTIFQKWVSSFDRLGFPTTGEVVTDDGLGLYNIFEKGAIYYTPETGAHCIVGGMYRYWADRGAEKSYLGYPTKDSEGDRTDFQRGYIKETGGAFYTVSDTRIVHTGTIHVDGVAANGWAELTLTSNGYFRFRGNVHASGAPSYDFVLAMTPHFADANGKYLTFLEEGDVEGTLVLGGSRDHPWDRDGQIDVIRQQWDACRSCQVTTSLKVNFGIGDLLAMIATVVGIPVAVIGMVIAGAFVTKNKKPCGTIDGEYYNWQTGQYEQQKSVYFVDKDEDCPRR